MAIDEDKMEDRNCATRALLDQREEAEIALAQVQTGTDPTRAHRARVLLTWLKADTSRER
jgi:hypothetical protein